MTRDLREQARQILLAGLKAVDPAAAVKRYVSIQDEQLTIAGKKVDYRGGLWVVGAGKGSAAMARALEEILGERISGGVVVTKYGYLETLSRIDLYEAGHPTPDENGNRAARRIIELVSGLGEDDVVLVLISGGGSALLPVPVVGVSLEDKMKTTELLLKSGASIQEMNAIRKHLSQIKGGHLARLAYPAQVFSLILSDVVGDHLDVIASGPTVADPSTYQECLEIVSRYGLQEALPEAVMAHLEAGAAGKVAETPKPDEPACKRSRTYLVGTNLQALEAAAMEAEKLGRRTLILSSLIEGDTGEAARFHAAVARQIVQSGHPLPRPACVISGGETTVVVRGKGKGGRNQHFALEAAFAIDGLPQICILSAGTDGTDGPTDAAGAVVDGSTISRARAKNLDARAFLENNDSYHFFKNLGDLVMTGPTNTNVMDLRIILVD
ncbi:MAG: glycerate kinase [Deltaproteobacteria bacterium]|nr:glycerate kinase [Deltaproteobacteria bacterium]